MEGTVVEARFAKWMESLIQPYFDDQGYGMGNEKTEDAKLLKSDMVAYACSMSMLDADRSSPCVKEAFAQFDGWMRANSSRNPISPYLRRTFYKTVMNFSSIEKDPEIVNFFLGKHEEAKTLRFRHQEHFVQLDDAYVEYKVNQSNTRSQQEETTGTLNMNDICSNVATSEMSIDTIDLGINILKICWYKLQSTKKAAEEVEELVSNMASRMQID